MQLRNRLKKVLALQAAPQPLHFLPSTQLVLSGDRDNDLTYTETTILPTQSHSRQSHTELGLFCGILLTPIGLSKPPYLTVLLHQAPQVKHISPTVLGYS